ncbi:Vacuolar membrane protease [Golovinomyces cichoracearum]|uniref:Peptide hydrolase n=1 Tax=Golovinomyces cichoracearum TaxID=62708 RepID=A0A420IAF8_9PEZI|nr:Vacuolar membrane protease [Golovinomyces cichoracearum]
MRLSSPFSFLPLTVTIVTTIVYVSITISLLVIHLTVPSAPQNPTPYEGLNLTEAWLDLDELSNGYHPFNSHRNDEVRQWIILRIKEILDKSNTCWVLEGSDQLIRSRNSVYSSTRANKTVEQDNLPHRQIPDVVVFNDLISNYTSTAITNIGSERRKVGISTYFEGSNIIVYIRGAKDKRGEWWKNSSQFLKHQHESGGVLVNAHFDSVSTGNGATDDGVGVVTALQLIKYYTTERNAPERGIVILFNNNEEDGLYGAKAFLSHPMATFIRTFLNLEGAGAGGRATLFRSTDLEVTRAYSHSPYPFGTVVSSDGFSLKFVRSETDYVVFRAAGYRGLDVAFWGPRSRYHTNQDDVKHTSKASVWHMLSSSLHTSKHLISDEYDISDDSGDVTTMTEYNSQGSDGVWFDLFGRFFVVFSLRALFAWSLSILIITPLTLLLISYVLIRHDKYYLFTKSIKPEGSTSGWVSIQGWHGVFRFPIVFIISSAFTLGAAFLLRNINSMIMYSSQYSVWSMFLSLFFCVFWFLMTISNTIRPSALHRTYVLIWMFLFDWVLLVTVTVYEDRFHVSSGYIFVFNHVAIFFATLIGLWELFALPSKASLIEILRDDYRTSNITTPISDTIVPPDSSDSLRIEQDGEEETEGEAVLASETTPLVGRKIHHLTGATFSRGYRRSNSNQSSSINKNMKRYQIYGFEQKWSGKLPTWTWTLQFLILAPFPLIILEQVGLLFVGAISQTGADGSALLFPYLITAIFSILLILPLAPFAHRITYHVPMFLFIILIGTSIYNLIAFPFSAQNRYKAFFQQTVDLDTGSNNVTIAGIEEYVREIISYIPSAAGQSINCCVHPEIRSGLSFCSYEGKAPNVLRKSNGANGFENWLSYNLTRVEGENKAVFHILGHETKACAIRFNQEFSFFKVHGATSHHGDVIKGGNQIKLWHRDWEREWIVEVEWPVSEDKKPGEEGRSGEVVCLWSDHNELGTIPALDELERFMPDWATSVKLSEGLVEGRRAFVIE